MNTQNLVETGMSTVDGICFSIMKCFYTKFQSTLSVIFLVIQTFVTVSGPTTALWMFFTYVSQACM